MKHQAGDITTTLFIDKRLSVIVSALWDVVVVVDTVRLMPKCLPMLRQSGRLPLMVKGLPSEPPRPAAALTSLQEPRIFSRLHSHSTIVQIGIADFQTVRDSLEEYKRRL